LPGVYLYRAVTYLALDEGQKAVNDLMGARHLDASSFPVNLGLGRALLLAERYEDAIAQIDSCEKLAKDDTQMAAVLYWRAQAVEVGESAVAAAPDWVALLKLPEEAVPSGWRRMAEDHLIALTPTPTETATITLSPTPTLKPTRTVTSTPTRKPPPAVTATPTRRPARTTTVTPTP
jgi:tetratricopeptide (TPR) repeat protein